MDGIFLVNKPNGITSAEVVRRMKYALKIERIGHAGTLDPMATGVLVILCGKATKLQSSFLGADKSYSGVIRLGLTTDSDDVTGNSLVEISAERVLMDADLEHLTRELTTQFTGTQLQIPPQYSAIKVDGVRSYKKARKQQEVTHTPREVSISNLTLLFESIDRIGFSLDCSKGTYVRSLARDIGEYLGTGGCLEELCRTGSAPFALAQTQDLESILRGDVGSYIDIEQLRASYMSDPAAGSGGMSTPLFTEK